MNLEKEEKSLLSQLRKIQYRTSVGKLTESDIKMFVKIIEILKKFSPQKTFIKGFLIAETPAAPQYHSNFSQEYIGPITSTHYNNENFYILRKKGKFRKFANQEYLETLFHFTIRCNKDCEIGIILENLKDRIDLSKFYIKHISSDEVEFSFYLLKNQ